MKTKVLTSFAVTVKLVCTFVFTYANCWFSHAVAQLSSTDMCSCIKLHCSSKPWAQFQVNFNMISIMRNPNRLYSNLVSDNNICILTSLHICARFITSVWRIGFVCIKQRHITQFHIIFNMVQPPWSSG